MNKVIYVKAPFKKVDNPDVASLAPKGKTQKSLLFGEKDINWEKTGYSDCEIDGKRFSLEIENAINYLNSEGYEVVTVVPIISGNHFHYPAVHQPVYSHSGFGLGFGYSFTEGVTIIGKKKENIL